MIDWGQVLQFSAFIALVIGGFIYLRSQNAKQQTLELEKLVETRGERIDDLEENVDRLKEKVIQLEAQIMAMQELQTQQIVSGIVEELRPHLRGTI